MNSFKHFIAVIAEESGEKSEISSADKKTIKKMVTASSEEAEKLKSELDSSKRAAKEIKKGATRVSRGGVRTRTRPSARGGQSIPSDALVGGDKSKLADVADDLRAKSTTSPEAKRAASNILGGGRKPESGEELVGSKPSKAQNNLFRATADAKKAAGNAPLVPTSGRSGLSDLATAVANVKDAPEGGRPARKRKPQKSVEQLKSEIDARNPTVKGPKTGQAIPQSKPEVVKQSVVSTQTQSNLKDFKRELLKRKESKPPTPRQLQRFTTGQQTGYIGPSGTPTSKGIQNYATRSVTRGFGDVDYNPAKRGVENPLKASQSVENLPQRAAAGEKEARKIVKDTYKKITGQKSGIEGYKDIVPSSSRTKAAFQNLSTTKKDLERAYNAPDAKKPPSSGGSTGSTPLKSSSTGGGRGGSSGGGVSTSPTGGRGGTATLEKPTTISPEIKSVPETTPATSKRPKVTKSVLRPTDRMSGIDPKPTKTKAPTVNQSEVSKAIKSQARTANQTLTKTTKLSGFKSALSRGASFTGKRVLPAVDAVMQFGTEKQKGSGNLRAAAKAATVWAGGALGATAGSVAGPIGTIAGGTAGAIGAEKAFDVAAGANAKTRAAMATANRQRQFGKGIVGTGGKTTFNTQNNTITTGGRTAKLAKTSVVTDPTTNKKEVGYLAYKDGKAVYKRGQDTSSLAQTSSNPLERIGRSLFPGAYVDHDKKQSATKLKQAQANDAAYRKALTGK
jgi:hypothetical protein